MVTVAELEPEFPVSTYTRILWLENYNLDVQISLLCCPVNEPHTTGGLAPFAVVLIGEVTVT